MIRNLNLAIMLAVATIGISVAPPPAHAQIAAAIGKPLPSSDLPAGKVVIRVIAGSIATPVVGAEVTLLVNGEPRQARSDSAGRANFIDLPVGATVQAKVLGDDKKDVLSEEFQIPESGGTRVMLTTKPLQGNGAGGGPMAGGGGMPAPRQMSGEPRYDAQFTAATITVVVTYNNLKMVNNKLVDDAPPTGIDVTLVGYNSANAVKVSTATTDAKGEVVFTDLDSTGNTTYFAMTQLPRNHAVDRLSTSAIQLDAQAGVKVVLSSEKKDSTDPVIDDLSKIAHQEPPTKEPGKLRVVVDGAPAMETVTLVDAATGAKLGTAKAQAGAADPSNYQSDGHFDTRADLPPGTLDIEVKGGPGQTTDAIPDVDVRVLDADAKAETGGMVTKTGDTGTVRMALAPDKKLKAIITLFGKPLVSQPFQLDKAGGKITLVAHWEETGRPEAIFDLAPKPNQVVYAELEMADNKNVMHTFRSAPLQGVEGHGTTVEIGVLPRLVFKFHLGGIVEDEFLGVSGEFEIDNYSWSPYSAGPDGLVIPLPKHFKGAVLDKQDQADVAVDQSEGFRIMKPLGPGKRTFRGGFSLPVSNGEVDWGLDLPFGAWQSNLNILQFPGMSVKLPPGTRGSTAQTESGQPIYTIPDIQIEPGHSMSLSIHGLPAAPAWKKWVPRIVGLVVISMMVTGVVMAILIGRRRTTVDTDRGARRAKLLDDLVEIDRGTKDNKRRDAVLAELEKLWED